jgi:hypothetical protein
MSLAPLVHVSPIIYSLRSLKTLSFDSCRLYRISIMRSLMYGLSLLDTAPYLIDPFARAVCYRVVLEIKYLCYGHWTLTFLSLTVPQFSLV